MSGRWRTPWNGCASLGLYHPAWLTPRIRAAPPRRHDQSHNSPRALARPRSGRDRHGELPGRRRPRDPHRPAPQPPHRHPGRPRRRPRPHRRHRRRAGRRRPAGRRRHRRRPPPPPGAGGRRLHHHRHPLQPDRCRHQHLAGRRAPGRGLGCPRAAGPGPQRLAGRHRPGRRVRPGLRVRAGHGQPGRHRRPLLALALVGLVGVRTAIALSVIPGLLAALAIIYAIRHAPEPRSGSGNRCGCASGQC